MFRTYEPTRDRLVAVKVFRLDITPEQAQSLADQLSVAAEAGLFHPSIVEPIAAGVEGTSAYRAEEYVAAESLDVAMRHYAPASIDKVLPFITQLAGAIDFARTAGLGHGALHPRDVFVTPEEARATGFGVVEALERVGIRAPVRRPYTAPERVAGQPWGTPADVFSLAVITYELLTGRRPAGTGTQIGSLAGSGAGPYADALHAVLAKAMDDTPERRFASALAFVSELEAASRGEGTGLAAAAPAAVPPDAEEAVAEMPPRADVDERHEPVETEQEEAAFRADEPEFDDIAAERDEDEAHTLLLDEEQAREREADAAGGRLLFDNEAVEDLALDAVAKEEAARFADEFSAAAEASQVRADEIRQAQSVPAAPAGPSRGLRGKRAVLGEPDVHVTSESPESDDERFREEEAEEPTPFAATSSFGGYDTTAPVIPERSRPAMLPIAITLVLALLVGFAAGYAVGVRQASPPGQQQAAGGDAEPREKAFSEQAITPPQPPAETPAPAGQPAPAPVQEAPAAKPTPSAPAAATTGRIVVRSSPSRAGVTLDGEWRGRTPLTLTAVPFGDHEVRIVQQGYGVAREDVTLSASTPQRTLSFTLRRSGQPLPGPTPQTRKPAAPQSFSGTIVVDSRPQGARVLLDGKMVGVTPIRLPEVRIGSHIIRLQLDDHRDWTTSIRVTSGRESRVSGSLERIR